MLMVFALLQRGLALLSLLFGAWWTLLALLALLPRREQPRANPARLRLVAIVPAHNEEALVATTVASLRATRFEPPPEVLVVADNCIDATAAVASAAGATVLERTDVNHRGKSFALDFAIAHLRDRPSAPDALVIVDADTTVNPGFFGAVAGRLASGSSVVQAHYEAAPGGSDVARLRRLALALVHWTRPLGASRIGLPTTLKGNGMAFAWDVARDGLQGSGITEDAAATILLAERGLTADFEPAAIATGQMAARYDTARTQDLRWEGGRVALLPAALSAGADALRRGDLRAAGAALEVASPPLTMAGATALASLACALLGLGSLRLAVASVAALASYVGLGLAAARAKPGDLRALLHLPRFALHKLSVYVELLLRRGEPEWTRTDRS